MLSDEVLEEFVEAGKIARKVKEWSKKLIVVETPLIDIAASIEDMIVEEGAQPAFPVNISINEVAAHYTPSLNDSSVIGENDVVKVDFGVRLNNGIADTAYTIDLSGQWTQLLEASAQALDKAIKVIRAGVSVSDVSAVIEDTITAYGFKPISNLTGHKIVPGLLHAGVEVPNVKNNSSYVFKEGDVFAIEPFATNGRGFVNDLDEVEIFSLIEPKPLHSRLGRVMLNHIVKTYGFLPFAQRWLETAFKSKLQVSVALKEMIKKRVVATYPVLREAGGGMVSQFEHTVIVREGGCTVTT
jgi:methionyl aminopeptidase